MANISLKFSFKNGGFCLCATKKNTTNRAYRTVLGLKNPDFNYWDSKKQRFEQATDDAIHNNFVLSQMKSHYQQLIDLLDPPTGKELFDLIQIAEKVEAKKPLTLETYLDRLISEMRNTKHRVPSTNYRLYITLLNKLKEEGTILNVSLSNITDEHFEAFGGFILNQLGGVNYKPLMKRFKTTINKARESKLTDTKLSYNYVIYTPTTNIDIQKAIKGVEVLSIKEYRKFTMLDLSQIPYSGKDPEYYKELYRDFCIFMYEMKMRPCDAINLQLDAIHGNNIVYLPIKKKNYLDKTRSVVAAPITKTARSIIDKYKVQSVKGFVFPFALNQRDWDKGNPDSFNKWYLRRQRQLEKINHFLNKVNDFCKFDCDKLTTYVFRHSTFTHAINSGKQSIIAIAKEGGTSVSMLEKHYYNHIKQ